MSKLEYLISWLLCISMGIVFTAFIIWIVGVLTLDLNGTEGLEFVGKGKVSVFKSEDCYKDSYSLYIGEFKCEDYYQFFKPNGESIDVHLLRIDKTYTIMREHYAFYERYYVLCEGDK